MTTDKPCIWAEITFLPASDGGRIALPGVGYRPHAVVEDGEYLGIEFVEGSPAEFGVPSLFRLALTYHPEVDYSALVQGAAFTVREGRKVVATGRVLGPA